MAQQFTDLSRLSLNQITTDQLSLREAVAGCVRFGIPTISLWRNKVADTGLHESENIVRDAGLNVSSLCRGGWFPASSPSERQQRLDDNRRAIEEAAALGTDVLVLVCGPAVDKDLPTARAYIEEAIASLLPFAADHGIRLAIEPLHPMFAGDRSAIVTLQQANDMVHRLAHPYVGVIVDVYHVWWDPEIAAQIANAAGHILGFHVSDWLVPTPDMVQGRGMMGDGVIDLRHLRSMVDATGYAGPIEVEIMNRTLWQMPGDDLLRLMCDRFLTNL
jgi:sugar phosphate isomerase/epimerase